MVQGLARGRRHLTIYILMEESQDLWLARHPAEGARARAGGPAAGVPGELPAALPAAQKKKKALQKAGNRGPGRAHTAHSVDRPEGARFLLASHGPLN